MTVFGSVTATISPTLTSYIGWKGKLWKTAFISSLKTLSGVEYSVYKKKGCWQIKGDWERIKHAHRILAKVTRAPDWPGPAGREAGAGRPGRAGRRWGEGRGQAGPPAEGGGGQAEDGEGCSLETGLEPGPSKSEDEACGPEVEVKVELDDPTPVMSGTETTTHPDIPQLVQPSALQTGVQDSMTSADVQAGPSSGVVNRRKRGRPRKVQTTPLYPQSDMGAADPTLREESGTGITHKVEKEAEEIPEATQHEFSASDNDNEDTPDSEGDPDFSIEDMIQEGKASLKVRLKGKMYSCNLCSFTCQNKNGVREHKKRQHTEKTLKCPTCDKVYGVMRDLRKHIRRHTAMYNCDQCGKTYKEERNYKQHLKTHQEDYIPPQFGCDQCEKSFTTKYVLQSHVDQVHKGNVPEWLCTKCGKKFKQKHSLAEHNLIHTGERPFACRICNKTFRHKGSRVNHELLHSNVRHFTCEICGKDFKHRNSLRIHAAIHNSIRNFKCSICNKTFTQKQALIRHSRIHSGEKPFMCELCGDRFNDNSILRRHMLGIHKTELKSGKQHYVLPADHYQAQGTGGTVQSDSSQQQQTGEIESAQGNLGGQPANRTVSGFGEGTESKAPVPTPSLRLVQEDALLTPHQPPAATIRGEELAGHTSSSYPYPLQTDFPTASFQSADSRPVTYPHPHSAVAPGILPLPAMDHFTGDSVEPAHLTGNPEASDQQNTGGTAQPMDSHIQPYQRLF